MIPERAAYKLGLPYTPTRHAKEKVHPRKAFFFRMPETERRNF